MENKSIVILISFFFLSIPFVNWGQNFKGKIIDVKGNPIVNATIQIKNLDDVNTYVFTTSNALGLFEFSKELNSKKNLLKVSFIGFQTVKREFEIKSETIDFGNIILVENINELKEVIVKAESSGILQKGDTTFFKIEKFLNGTEENLKDVIEKIPGLKVNDIGKITANGKTIDKLLINGEDLYKNQHQIATENLPSETINSIELIKNYIGFDDLAKQEKTGKTALNIKIKEEFTNKFTGFIEGGNGFKNQYIIKNAVFNFNKKFHFSAISNFNSIAENPITINDYYELLEEKTDENESGVIFSNLSDAPSFLTSRNKVSSKNNIFNSLSFVYNFNPKTKIDFYSIINNSKQSLSVFKEQLFYGENVDLLIFEDNENIEKNIFGILKTKFVYKNNNTIHKINSKILFDLNDNLNYINNYMGGFSKKINQNNQFNNYSSNFSYNLLKKINQNYFDFKSSYLNASNTAKLRINSNDFFLNPNYLKDNSLMQFYHKSVQEFRNTGSLQFKKINKFTFQLSHSANLISNKLNSYLNETDNHNDLNLKYFKNTSTINAKYQINSIVDVSFQPEFTFNNITFNSKSNFISFFGYSTNLKIRFSSTNVLSINNSFLNNNTNIDNLLNAEIVKDYRTVTSNDNVNSEAVLPSMDYTINYFNFDVKKKFSLIFNASHKQNLKSIDNNIYSTENITYLNNSIIKNEKINSFLLFLEKQPQQIPLSLSGSISYSNLSKIIVNNDSPINFESGLLSYYIEIKSKYKKAPIYFTAGLRASNENYKYNNSKNNLNSYQLYSKINGIVCKNFFWDINSDYFSFKNVNVNSNYLSISPIIRFSKEKSKFDYSLVGNNILNLNNKSIIENFSNSNYSEIVRKPIFNGYFLAQIKFKF